MSCFLSLNAAQIQTRFGVFGHFFAENKMRMTPLKPRQDDRGLMNSSHILGSQSQIVFRSSFLQ